MELCVSRCRQVAGADSVCAPLSCEERNWFVLIPAALIHSHPHQIIQLITGFGWKASVLCQGLRDMTDLVKHQCYVFCVFMNF